MECLGKLSVIIPVYCKEDTVERCIESVLKQNYDNLEIIIVDDGSPDRCGAICDDYAGRYHKVRVIHQKNKGVSEARNCGIRAASGEYITFADADDTLAPDFASRLIPLFDQQTQMVVSSNHQVSARFQLELDRDTAWRRMFDDDNFGVNVWGKIYKKSLAIQQRFPVNIAMGEDMWYLFQAVSHSEKIRYVSDNYYHQMRSEYNSANLSGVKQYFEALIINQNCLKSALESQAGYQTQCAIRRGILKRAVWMMDVMGMKHEVKKKYLDAGTAAIKESMPAAASMPFLQRLRMLAAVTLPRLYIRISSLRKGVGDQEYGSRR